MNTVCFGMVRMKAYWKANAHEVYWESAARYREEHRKIWLKEYLFIPCTGFTDFLQFKVTVDHFEARSSEKVQDIPREVPEIA